MIGKLFFIVTSKRRTNCPRVMAGSKQQKVMHGREASPLHTLDMKSLHHFLKLCRNTIGRKLCFVLFKTEIFPLAGKVSKLQNLLSAIHLYHRELYCVFTLQRYVWHFGCCGRQDSGLSGWQGTSQGLDGLTELESCPSHLNCCNGTESVKPWICKVCVRGTRAS